VPGPIAEPPLSKSSGVSRTAPGTRRFDGRVNDPKE
jgi:hypothetical protein